MEKFYTCEELADVLKVNIITIYRYIRANKIKAHKFGKQFRISQDSLNEFFDNSKATQ